MIWTTEYRFMGDEYECQNCGKSFRAYEPYGPEGEAETDLCRACLESVLMQTHGRDEE